MAKRKVLQVNEGKISTAVENAPKRTVVKKKKNISIDWSSLFRLIIMLILVGIIVFHYYLITENAFISYYMSIWMNNKEILAPILIIMSYTLTIFLLGFWLGRRKK